MNPEKNSLEDSEGELEILVKDLDSGSKARVDETDFQNLDKPVIANHSHWQSYWQEHENLQQKLLNLVNTNKVQELRDTLSQHPVDLNKYQYEDGWNLLHHAVNKGFYSIAALLLVEGIDKNKQTKQMNNTPLHVAVLQNLSQITQLLITQGADPNLFDADFSTPLHYAAQYGYSTLVKIILSQSEQPIHIQLKNRKGMTISECCRDEKTFLMIKDYNRRRNTFKSLNNEGFNNHRVVSWRNGTTIKVKSRADHVENILQLVSLHSPEPYQAMKKNYSLVGSKIQRNRFQYMERMAQRSISNYKDLLHNFNTETIKDYVRIRKIGEGSYGQIYLARRKNSSKLHAIKALSKLKITKQKIQKYVYAERDVLKNIHHPFIMHGSSFFQDSHHLFMVMEFCGGGDLQKIIRISPFPQQLTKYYACEVTLAIQKLHHQNILFRDLKTSNILIDNLGHVKVTDFGLAKKSQTSNSFLGTYAYLPPQMLVQASEKYHDRSIDWYLLGVFIYEMLTGLPPFYNSDRTIMFQNIKNAQPAYPEGISPECQDILKKLLEKNPQNRLGRKGVVRNHEWFKDINWENAYHGKLQLPIPKIDQKQLRRKGFIQEYDQDPYNSHYFAEWDFNQVQDK